MKWARGQMRADELDVQMLMTDFSRRLDSTLLPAGRTVVEFAIPGLPKFGRWWIVIEADGTRELCANQPGHEANVMLRVDLRTLGEIWAGDTTIPLARTHGRLVVTGDPQLVRTVSRWLRPGALAHIRPARKPLPV
jgi:hypothetical protein